MKPTLAFFIRMLRQQSRDRGVLLSRLTIGLLLLLGLWIAHLEATTRGASGRAFFNFVIATNYLLLTVAALGIGSQAIAEEKEAGTLGLLRLTSLSPISILLGKAGAGGVALVGARHVAEQQRGRHDVDERPPGGGDLRRLLVGCPPHDRPKRDQGDQDL